MGVCPEIARPTVEAIVQQLSICLVQVLLQHSLTDKFFTEIGEEQSLLTIFFRHVDATKLTRFEITTLFDRIMLDGLHYENLPTQLIFLMVQISNLRDLVKIVKNCPVNFLQATNQNGDTPLHLACILNDLEAVQILTNFETINLINSTNGRSPLHAAMIHSSFSIVNCLVRSGARINVKDKHGNTPFMLAAQYANAEVCRLLVEYGANLGEINNRDCDALILAIKMDNFHTINYLIEIGIPIDTKYQKSLFPIHYACRYNSIEALKCLIEHGADVNDITNDQWDCLHFATRYSVNISMIQLLLNNGCKLGSVNIHGRNALHYAAGWGSKEMVKLLLRCGIDINSRDNLGRCAVHLASKFKNYDVLKFLIHAGADIAILTNARTSIYDYSETNCQMIRSWEDDVEGYFAAKVILSSGCMVKMKVPLRSSEGAMYYVISRCDETDISHLNLRQNLKKDRPMLLNESVPINFLKKMKQGYILVERNV
eukprot:TRINITY_DN10236_c0_g1_i1.p1 TRINITY_DN10236_c0_g1~~TRINITY_DN10236_c0_g1_i1.p1  ORF type:complete len:485 (+),score=71.29 TRINITY_DN10236_c0_g1_i1:48-1502(+)